MSIYTNFLHIKLEKFAKFAIFQRQVNGEQQLSISSVRRQNQPLVQSMVKAYVLIKAQIGKEDSVLREVLSLSVTDEAHKVFGPYDIVAEVRGRDMETLVEIITDKLRKIEGIEDTQSILVIDSEIDMTSTSFMS